MEKIFLSFRSSDTQEATRSIYQSLSHEFGKDSLFYFPESNFAGDRFVDKIFTALRQSTIFIAIIGREYVTAKDDEGNIRIFNESDLVRKELAYALKNKMTVIPILVGNTPFPKTQQLPPDIQSLLDIDFQNIDFNKGYDYGIRLLKENIYRTSNFKQTQTSKTFLSYLGIGLGTLLFAGFAYYVIDAFGILNPREIKTAESTAVDTLANDTGVLDNPIAQPPPQKEKPTAEKTATANEAQSSIENQKSEKRKSSSNPAVNAQGLGSMDNGNTNRAAKQAIVVEQQAAAKPAAANYYLSDLPYEVGVLQCSDASIWDFSKTLSNFFNSNKKSSSHQIFNAQFKADFLAQINAGNYSGLKKAGAADKLTCIYLMTQDLEKSINPASGLTILKLNARISRVDLQSYTSTEFAFSSTANGTSENAAIKQLEKRFTLDLLKRKMNEKICL